MDEDEEVAEGGEKKKRKTETQRPFFLSFKKKLGSAWAAFFCLLGSAWTAFFCLLALVPPSDPLIALRCHLRKTRLSPLAHSIYLSAASWLLLHVKSSPQSDRS